MIRLLAFLFTGCWHKWAILQQGKTFDPDRRNGLPIGNWYDLQCERCGTVKRSTP